MSAFNLKRWKAAPSLMLADLRNVKSLAGIFIWAVSMLVISVALLRARLPNLGEAWA